MIARVFLATINYDHPQHGMLHAFEGIFGKANVGHYDYLQRLRDTNHQMELVNGEFLEQAAAFKPDWLWLQLQTTNVVTKSTLQELRRRLPKAVFSHWMGDIRHEVGEYLADVAKATHLTLTSSKGYLPLFIQAGAQEAHYLQIGLDWAEDVLGLPEWTPPFRVPAVVFIGNHYGGRFPGWKERESAVRSLRDAEIDVGIVGDGWADKSLPHMGRCQVKQQVHVWRRAKVAISVNHFPDVAGYYSDRHLTALVSGTPLVCRYIPKLEEEFENGKHLFWYRSEEELVATVRRLLSDEVLRKAVGACGRAEVIRNHTWFSRILTILPRVEEIKKLL